MRCVIIKLYCEYKNVIIIYVTQHRIQNEIDTRRRAILTLKESETTDNKVTLGHCMDIKAINLTMPDNQGL